MRFGQIIATSLFVTLSTSTSLMAQSLLSVYVKSAPLKLTAHTEKSYAGYSSYLSSLTPPRALSDKDYYTSFTVVSQLRTSIGSCRSATGDIGDFFSQLIGETRTSLTVVTVSASTRLGAMGAPTFLKDLPLFSVGRGADPSNGTAVANGCFYISGLDVREPYMRHDGGGPVSDYEIVFSIHQADSVTINAITNIDSALQLYAGLEPTDFSGSKAAAVQTATNSLQTAIGAAFAHTKTITIKDSIVSSNNNKDVYHISTTGASASGNIAVYARLSASMVLDQGLSKVSFDDVLDDMDIGSQRCLAPIAGGVPCTLSQKLFWDALHAEDSSITSKSFFDKPFTNKILDVCDSVRDFARANLALSTLDTLLVRWAALKKGGLYDVLTNDAKKSQLRTSLNVTDADLTSCWSDDDEKLLRGVGKAMKVEFQ